MLLWKSCFESIIPQTKPNQTALSKWVKCSDAMLSNVTTLRLATRTPVVSNVVALQESWYYLYQTWSFVISFRVTFTWPSKPLLRTWPATGYEQTRLKNGAAAGRSPPSTCCVQFSLLMFHCMNVLFLWNKQNQLIQWEIGRTSLIVGCRQEPIIMCIIWLIKDASASQGFSARVTHSKLCAGVGSPEAMESSCEAGSAWP